MEVSVFKAKAWLVLAWLVLVSADAEALRWTVHPILQDGTNVSARPYDLAFGNGRFVGIDSRTTFFAQETEPHLWSQGATIADADLHKVVFGNGVFVAAGQDTKSQTGLLVTSTDGVQWSRHVFEEVPRMAAVAHGNGRFVAVGGDLTAISTNGTEWLIQTNVVRPPLYLRWIDFANGEFFAAVQTPYPAAHPCSQLATSRDGTNWELHEGFCGEFQGGMAYGRNAYVLLGLNDCCGSLYLSAEGRSWQQREYPVPFVGSGIAYANGFFAIAGHSGFLSSTDARTWEAFRLQSAMLFSGIAFGAGRFVAVGSTWNEGKAAAAVSEVIGPPRLFTEARIRDGAIEIRFETEEQREWFVEGSENLVDWIVAGQVAVTASGVQTVTVPMQPGATRFFRLR